MVSLEDSLLSQCIRDDTDTSYVHEKLKGLIFGAMSHLNLNCRAVLALRCFEQMSFSEIAQITKTSSLKTGISFILARQLLKRQLVHKGFSRSSLLPAIVFFGKITPSLTALGL